jgi:hypothetical protein
LIEGPETGSAGLSIPVSPIRLQALPKNSKATLDVFFPVAWSAVEIASAFSRSVRGGSGKMQFTIYDLTQGVK